MNPPFLKHRVFIAGGTGYRGSHLIPELLKLGHELRALVRPGSERRLPSGVTEVVGNALESASFSSEVRGCDTFIHLVGVPHANPSKAAQFRTIDLKALQAAASAASDAGIKHFVYVSVAQPAAVMRDYVQVRGECEAFLRETGLNAAFLRPWYVLGPGHRWPYLLLPMYWITGLLPSTRETSRRLGLVTIEQTTRALVWAVENPPRGVRIVDVPQIREL